MELHGDPQPGRRSGDRIAFRTSRTFNLGPAVRFQPQVAVFDLLNANAALGTVKTHGARWQAVNAVLGSRVVKFGAQLRF